MKLLPSPTYARKAMRSDDSLGRAMEAAFTMIGFFGIGYALDRWLGTTPVFMIVCTVLAAVGLFYAWKARYMAHMEQLEADRRRLSRVATTDASERPAAACVAGER
jgi:F0F1-type ATP synthase assembly protein I